MKIKNSLILFCLLVTTVFCAYNWYISNSRAGELQKYVNTLESVNDSLLTSSINLNGEIIDLYSINAKKIQEVDDLSKQLETLQFKLDSRITSSVIFDTLYVRGIADTVYVNDNETVYTINKVTKNYTVTGNLSTPSGEYFITVTQMPFGLELREVTTPSGRKRVYANITGRDDLQITDIEFVSSEPTKSNKNVWAIGPGVIFSESGVDWGIGLRRNRLSLVGTKNSISSTIELLRF